MYSTSKSLISFLSIICFSGMETTFATAPHIIFILADDMGWNDVSFHGSDQIPTPNIDALAYSGVILNSHFVQPICTPSRVALMTGLYPIHTGMQGDPMYAAEKRALPKGKILPEYLKDLNYATVAIGKWHLGYYQEDYLPNSRGFDSFLGHYNGYNSYYDYTVEAAGINNEVLSGFDLRRNTTPAYDLVGQYATDAFTDEAVDRILHHDTSKPLFLYMSHLAPHAGNNNSRLLEAPQEVIDQFRYIANAGRRTYAAMVAKLDESVGRIVSALEKRDMLQNSIVIFLSDNGAPTVGGFLNWGSNYPLKGIKGTLWEGGVRGAGLIWSPFIDQAPRISNELMHICDWLPTLYAAAGGNPSDLPALDGINQWETITKNSPTKRSEILFNIDEILNFSAIRVDRNERFWKLHQGVADFGDYDHYYGEGTNRAPEFNPPYNLTAITNSVSYKALEESARKHNTKHPTSIKLMPFLREQATVNCNYTILNGNLCSPKGNKVCLYDIKTDPCELNDLSLEYPLVVANLLNKLKGYKLTLVPQPFSPQESDLANPAFFNGTWSPWYDKNGLPYALQYKWIK